MIQLVAKSWFDRPKRTRENYVFRSTDISRVRKTLQNDRLSFHELDSPIWELQRAFVGVSFIISNVVTEQITVRNPHFVECVGKLRKKKLLIQTQNPSGLLIINLITIMEFYNFSNKLSEWVLQSQHSSIALKCNRSEWRLVGALQRQKPTPS